jgi:hypothetical protein
MMEADNIVWGTGGDVANIVWGTSSESDNVTWGCSGEVTPLFDNPDVPTEFGSIDFDALLGDGTEQNTPLPVSDPLPPVATVPDPVVVPPPTVPVVGGGF